MTIGSPRSSARSSSVSSTDLATPLPSLEGLIPARPPTTTSDSETRLPIPYLDRDVTLKVDAGPGCGGIAWPAGEVLSRYIAYRHSHSPQYLRGRIVLELGSGTGLVGIVAAMLESSTEVWITDQPQLLGLMKINAALNIVDPSFSNVHIAELNWGETLSQDIPVKETRVILAADCVYFEPAFPLLVKTLCDLAPVEKEVEILFCWKKRRKADKRFFIMLRKEFDWETVMDDRSEERERYGREGVSLIRLKRK